MFRYLLLVLIVATAVAHSYEGEVIEINHSNLLKFQYVQAADCTQIAGKWRHFLVHDWWIHVDYQDGQSVRRVVFPRRSDRYDSKGYRDCADAKAQTRQDLTASSLFHHDILRNNIKVNKFGICEELYKVATLGKEITHADGSKAELADYESAAERAVKCPTL